MKLTQTKETETKLLSRKRITFEAESKGVTPSRSEIVKEIAKSLKIKPELVIVKHIYTKFGSKKIKIIAHIYKNRKDLESVEEKYLVDKHKIEEEKKEEPEKKE